MKTIVNILVVFTLLAVVVGCEDTEDLSPIQKTGTVVDYAGSGNCGFVIELEDGSSILPIHYPENFTFGHGQLVWVEFIKIPNVNPLCDRGMPCEISAVEELTCASYTNLNLNNYDSLSFDAVYIHEIYLDGDCLHIKLSYSGGCEDHIIDLARIHKEGQGNTAVFEIRHEDNGDVCEAYITKNFRYDLSALANEGIHDFTIYAKMFNEELYSESFYYAY